MVVTHGRLEDCINTTALNPRVTVQNKLDAMTMNFMRIGETQSRQYYRYHC